MKRRHDLVGYLRSYAPCPISELVRVFGVKQSSMTSLLDRLQERGLVTRTLNPEDRRSFLVGLTKRGRSLANRLQRIVADIEDQLGRRVSERDMRGYQAVMNAINDFTRVTVREENA